MARKCPWCEIRPDSGEAQWLRRFYIPLRRPSDRRASSLFLSLAFAPQARRWREARGRSDASADRRHGLLLQPAEYRQNRQRELRFRLAGPRIAEKSFAQSQLLWLFHRSRPLAQRNGGRSVRFPHARQREPIPSHPKWISCPVRSHLPEFLGISFGL